MRTWSNDEKEREKIELLLCDIGKGDSSYYIPDYLDSIESYVLRSQWIYRVLQILLAASFVAIPILPADRALVPFVAMCSLNMAVYVWFNLKHTLELGLVGTAVSLLRNAKLISGKKG